MRWLTAFLTWLSAEPGAVETHVPRAAASSQAAYATLVREAEKEGGVGVVPTGTCPDGKCPTPVRK
jgi:hypothetical protein